MLSKMQHCSAAHNHNAFRRADLTRPWTKGHHMRFFDRLPKRKQFETVFMTKSKRSVEENEVKPASAAQNDEAYISPEEATRKFGLEAGLWKVFAGKNSDGQSKGEQAKQLLKRYGSAYLITSISFAIVSFTACYALVSAGVDVANILGRIGLNVTDNSERVGTAAIAYAAHKALSPVRFPPTVALTPVVARWLGKETDSSES